MIAGEKIKRERIKRGLSQEELGELLEVTKVSVCGYETGTRTPTIHTLEKITEVLELSPNELLGYQVYAVSEEGVPYEVQLKEAEIHLIRVLRTHKQLYQELCSHPEETLEKLSKLREKK